MQVTWPQASILHSLVMVGRGVDRDEVATLPSRFQQ